MRARLVPCAFVSNAVPANIPAAIAALSRFDIGREGLSRCRTSRNSIVPTTGVTGPSVEIAYFSQSVGGTRMLSSADTHHPVPAGATYYAAYYLAAAAVTSHDCAVSFEMEVPA